MTDPGQLSRGTRAGRGPPLPARAALARLLFWLPEAEAPGLAACGVALARIPLLTILASAPVGALAATLAARLVPADSARTLGLGDPGDLAGRAVFTGALAGAIELGRYGFARRARDRAAALRLYSALTALTFAGVLAAAAASPGLIGTCLLFEPLASLALFAGWPYASDRPLLVTALALTHAAAFALPGALSPPTA